MKKTNLTLPEWAFLDCQSHLGNLLDGRDVLQHVRSYTMLEVFASDEMEVKLKDGVKTKSFIYKNRYGIVENHLLVVHFSLAEYGELDDILDKAVDFYSKYLDWEDRNIENESIANVN